MPGKCRQDDRMTGCHSVQGGTINRRVSKDRRADRCRKESARRVFQDSCSDRLHKLRPLRVRGGELEINQVRRANAHMIVRVVKARNDSAAAKIDLFRQETSQLVNLFRIANCLDTISLDCKRLNKLFPVGSKDLSVEQDSVGRGGRGQRALWGPCDVDPYQSRPYSVA